MLMATWLGELMGLERSLISCSCATVASDTLDESLEEARELEDGEIGVVTELLRALRCCRLRRSSVATVEEEEVVEECRDFRVMFPLHRGHVCLIFSQGSTQFLWNSCL